MNTLVNDALAQPSQGDASVSYLPRSVRIGKRLFDLVVASLMLVATAPLFPLMGR